MLKIAYEVKVIYIKRAILPGCVKIETPLDLKSLHLHSTVRADRTLPTDQS